jgi:hypothetical protein
LFLVIPEVRLPHLLLEFVATGLLVGQVKESLAG